MAIIPFLNAAVRSGGSGGFFGLIGKLMLAVTAVEQVAELSGGQIIDLPFLRKKALQIAPGAPAVALEESARWVARILGMGGDDLFWPRDRKTGRPIPPMFMVLDFSQGRAWITGRTPTTKSKRTFRKRGQRWGGYRAPGGGTTIVKQS